MSPVPGSDEIGRTKYPPALTIKFATFSRKPTSGMMAVGGLPAEMVVHMLVSTRMSPQYGKDRKRISIEAAVGANDSLLWPHEPNTYQLLINDFTVASRDDGGASLSIHFVIDERLHQSKSLSSVVILRELASQGISRSCRSRLWLRLSARKDRQSMSPWSYSWKTRRSCRVRYSILLTLAGPPR